MWCFHWPYRLAGRMMEDKVDHAFAHIFWVIAILRFGVALQHCQQAAGIFSSKAWSSPVNATWCYSSWTRIGPVENLQCYSIALSHFSADVYFPASAISIFCSIQKKIYIYIKIHNRNKKEMIKTCTSDSQWKVEVAYVNWLLFVGKKNKQQLQLVSRGLAPRKIWPLCFKMTRVANLCDKISVAV